jgi:hypothetical protein
LVACAPAPRFATSICQVAAAPHAFRGRTLTVEGVLLASRHGIVITDPVCEAGVAIEWRGDAPGLRDLDDLVERALSYPPVRRTVRIRVTGEMKRESNRNWVGLQGWFLDLSSAEVLSSSAVGEHGR